MAKIKLFNTLTDKKEVFSPVKEGEVKLYTCGPTVYGPGHLGHARSYTSFDLLKRVFLYNGYRVKHILNITDIHDDMIAAAEKENTSIDKLAARYIPMFKEDLDVLNIIPADKYPRVTGHIEEIIEMVKILVDKGYAYVKKDGSVYFDISKFDGYGNLAGIKPEEARTGTRVETDKYDKENAADFALWKGYKQGEPFWDSPWGKGRPGWHIECSVMAEKYLGKTIDIHAGAMDLKFPHHENELAQSEAANDQRFVNYWVHAGLLEIEGQKMSKSLGNFLEIRDIINKNYQPLALRYLFLMTHYRSNLNFTWRGLQSAQNALKKLRYKINDFEKKKNISISNNYKKYRLRFTELINDNLAVPQALGLLWEVVEDPELKSAERFNLALDFDRVLGLNLDESFQEMDIPQVVLDLAEKRNALRNNEKWEKADEIRLKIEEAGFSVKDTQTGYKIKPLD